MPELPEALSHLGGHLLPRTLVERGVVLDENDGVVGLADDLQELAVDVAAQGAKVVARAIQSARRRRSGRQWVCRIGRGTAYSWLTIDAPPRMKVWHWRDTGRRDDRGHPIMEEYRDPSKTYGHMGPGMRIALARLLGLDEDRVHVRCDGVSIPAGRAYYREYLDRAETGRADENGVPYWD